MEATGIMMYGWKLRRFMAMKSASTENERLEKTPDMRYNKQKVAAFAERLDRKFRRDIRPAQNQEAKL